MAKRFLFVDGRIPKPPGDHHRDRLKKRSRRKRERSTRLFRDGDKEWDLKKRPMKGGLKPKQKVKEKDEWKWGRRRRCSRFSQNTGLGVTLGRP